MSTYTGPELEERTLRLFDLLSGDLAIGWASLQNSKVLHAWMNSGDLNPNSWFAWGLREVCLRESVLALARLINKKDTDSATIHKLLNWLEQNPGDRSNRELIDIRGQVRRDREWLEKSTLAPEVIRLRNQVLAHTDQRLLRGELPASLPLNIDELETHYLELRDLVSRHYKWRCDAEFDWECITEEIQRDSRSLTQALQHYHTRRQ